MKFFLILALFFSLSVFCDEGEQDITSQEIKDHKKSQEKKKTRKEKRKARIKKMRKRCDKNNDGKLSDEEKESFHKALLGFEMRRKRKQLVKETSRDGKLSNEEKKEIRKDLQKFKENFLKRFRKKNRRQQNGNEDIRRAPHQRFLERFDTNNDGVLSEEEKQKMREERGKKRGRRGKRNN